MTEEERIDRLERVVKALLAAVRPDIGETTYYDIMGEFFTQSEGQAERPSAGVDIDGGVVGRAFFEPKVRWSDD
jgi:hypothetical protein